MKVMLIQTSLYVPALGGANKANKALMEQLSLNGISCKVLCPALSQAQGIKNVDEWVELLQRKKASDIEAEEQRISFSMNGVEVVSIVQFAGITEQAKSCIEEFNPDWIFVSSEDPFQNLLSSILQYSPHNVVYLCHTAMLLPFGPDSSFKSVRNTELLREPRAIVVVSEYLKRYMKQWAGLESTVIRFPVYDDGPYPDFSGNDDGYVVIINPSKVKGIDIFVSVCDALPNIPFAAVPTWGTTDEDLKLLEERSNVTVLEPNEDIDVIFSKTRLLVVPSLWGEAFGQIVVEAMLRGIPVISSDMGGLPEAKLGTNYVLHVNGIREYSEAQLDDKMMPVPVIPPQNISEWSHCVERLYLDKEVYSEESGLSRTAALHYASGLSIGPFLKLLSNLPEYKGGGINSTTDSKDSVRQKLANLSNKKKQELLALIRKGDNR